MSEPIEIPLANAVPLWVQRTTLDEREYLFRFDWNGRENRWAMSLSTITGDEVCRGIKLVANWSILRRFRWNPVCPQGLLVAQDFSPQGGEPPGFYDLGKRVRLVYFPPDQVEQVVVTQVQRGPLILLPSLRRQDFTLSRSRANIVASSL